MQSLVLLIPKKSNNNLNWLWLILSDARMDLVRDLHSVWAVQELDDIMRVQ